jgi:DNA gyrase subunit A
MGLLEIDEIQARAILDMQLRKLAALERQELVDERDELEARIADLSDILASPARQRQIIGTELGEIVDRYGDERRTQIIAYEGDVTDEDLIAESDVVVTITHGGYAKRTNTDQYRAQRRGGKGVRGAQLRSDDIVDHFFVTTTHHWILFFTNKGRAKAYELPDAGRDARGQHVANMLAFQPDEHIAEVLALRDYQVAPYLMLATRSGLVKKSRLTDFDSPRSGGLIAINLREDDEVIGASLVSPEEDLLLISKGAQAIRFPASDDQLRPMGRATSGVIGMRFNEGDELLGMYVVREGEDVLVATDAGYAKRTPADQYPVRNRGGYGVITARIVENRGGLVGALMVRPEDEVFAITSVGGVIRTRASGVKQSGRQTMGVRLMNLSSGDSVVALARNAESAEDSAVVTGESPDDPGESADGGDAHSRDEGNEQGHSDV